MKTIAITGATGFVGIHVIRYLKAIDKFHIVAVGRNIKSLQSLGTEYVVYDLNKPKSDCYSLLKQPDHLIHLAWENLPNYNDIVHIEKNLVNSYRFLKCMVSSGLTSMTVAGTCLEYGKQNGCLDETTPTIPATCYGVAKDALRSFMECLNASYPLCLKWLRLFYVYGKRQAKHSLMAQLNKAITSNLKEFDMSPGEQIRDFLSIEETAMYIAKIALQSQYDGIFNICSGIPVSVRGFVEEQIKRKKINMKMNLGKYPYLEYEPLAFWGNPSKLLKAVEAYDKEYGNGS